MVKMNKQKFIAELANINILQTLDQLNQLEEYANYLLEYNKLTNLTAIKTIDEIYLKHFYDSLTIIKVIDLNKYNSLLDIGTGAGFPGLVLKIFYPNLNVTLLDSNNKKTKFLTNLVKKLNLSKIEIVNERAEQYCQNNRENYDIVTSRAVSSMQILAELSLPFVKVNGYFIPLKANVKEELAKSHKAIEILGGKIEIISEFKLPIENSTRTIIKILKTKPSPNIYPRSYDKIIKKPLVK